MLILAVASFVFDISVSHGGVIVSVADYGATGNGVANDAIAIQAALDSGASIVTIPNGVYSINQGLLIGSGTTLQVDPNAIIRLANNTNEWMISNRNPGDSNIIVTGGIWDGNNMYNDRGSDSDPNAYTGTVINFVDVSNIEVSNLTIRNPEAYSMALGKIENFLVENITLEQFLLHPNQDGIHVGGYSHHGVIRGITASTANTPNDDMVAINADDDPNRSMSRAMPCGPISDILIEDIQAEEAYNFVRILSNTSPIEDITVRRVSGGCRIYAVNMNNWRFPTGAGDIRNVVIEDFDVYRVGTNTSPMIDIALSVDNLRISDFVRSNSSSAATLRLRNNQASVLQLADGAEFGTVNYTVPSGNIEDLRINLEPKGPLPPQGPRSPSAVSLVSGNLSGHLATNVLDENLSTFIVVQDDTLNGNSTDTDPDYGSAPVTGHMVFDMGETVRMIGAILTSRYRDLMLMPKDVDFFYYADDDPFNNVIPDDIEGDADIVSITNHVFSDIKMNAAESVDWSEITARYIGMRVNSSYESGPTSYNFQLAEIQFVLPELVPGDANGDGKVDGSDVTVLAGNWQVLSGATWSMGDFNGDGRVDGSDVTILAGNWQSGVSTSAVSIPEPSIFVLLLAAMVGLSIILWR